MAHFNFVISQNAKWEYAGFYIDFHRMTVPENILLQKKHWQYQGENNLYVDSCNTTIGQKSVRHKGPKLWNELPTSLKLCTPTKTFNRQLKTYLRSITG